MRASISRLLLGLAASLAALAAPQPSRAQPAAATDPEARAAALMAAVRGDAPMLRVFLQAMPKGGDLHNHLGGAIYAEDLLAWAAANGLCIGTDRVRVSAPPCDKARAVAAASLAGDYERYSRAIDAFSTRGFESGNTDPLRSGADRFFATFDDFGEAYAGNAGKALAIAREQAAGDNLQYLELQVGSGRLDELLPKDWAKGLAPTDFAGLLARLDPILARAVPEGRAMLASGIAEADAIERCGAPAAAPGCAVKARFLMSAMRTYTPDAVFAEIAYGFAITRADPHFVGVNIVAPEHDPVATRDYRLHMAMFAFLKQRYPEVRLTLHAGELALGMVPPRDLKFHIHDAVAVAGALRIGHGVDIAYEDGSLALLQQMARERIAVEVNLTSNAVILGVKGKAHPLALYRAAGVPVALSTDDEGVSRTDMTNEYMRAAIEQGLGYRDLKQIARDSLEYGFEPGASLWRDRAGGARVAECAVLASADCAAFAAGSEKAGLERTLELKFADFERTFAPDMRRTLRVGASPTGDRSESRTR